MQVPRRDNAGPAAESGLALHSLAAVTHPALALAFTTCGWRSYCLLYE